MKNIIKIITITSLLFTLFISCASSNGVRQTKDPIKNAFSVSNRDDYIIIDKTPIIAKDIIGIKERMATVIIRKDNYMAGWGSIYMAAYYFVQFDTENRKILRDAMNNYLDDFENKRLDKNGKKTKKAYGTISYQLNWGSISTSTPNNGTGKGMCGYEFVNDSPYFIISNYPFKNNFYEQVGELTSRESLQLKYYFTRSQIKNLVNLISEENIENLINSKTNIITTPTIADEYLEI